MIPSEEQAKCLWDTYNLPREKRVHCELVAHVALLFARELRAKKRHVRADLLFAAALLHDIDKSAPSSKNEHHPDTAVRILVEEGMPEVAALVKTHPLHAILDPTLAPKTWEEKLLFLADKMVKYEVIDVDRRFALWRAEVLPAEARAVLDRSYPKVKELEREVFARTGLTPSEVASRVKT